MDHHYTREWGLVNMRIGVAGSDGNVLCQLDAVRVGLQALGHEVVNWHHPDAAFVFVGNPPFGQYLEATQSKPFIFNVLDVCPHCYEHFDIVSRLSKQLPLAARVTTISESVQSQLAALCNVKADVIYYPMKDVTADRARKYPQFRAALVGRVADPNKRAYVAIASLVKAGFNESEVAIVGPERLPWGTYIGTVSDETLNDIYGSVDYVLMMSANEGIGLPAIESACAGALPVVLPDLSTYDEFWSRSPMGPYYQTFTSIDAISSFLIHMNNRRDELSDMQAAMLQYANIYLRPKFDKVEVAKRIINIYHGIAR